MIWSIRLIHQWNNDKIHWKIDIKTKYEKIQFNGGSELFWYAIVSITDYYYKLNIYYGKEHMTVMKNWEYHTFVSLNTIDNFYLVSLFIENLLS